MSTKYCDRAFVNVNGARLTDLQSCTLRQNRNAKHVPSMTPDPYNRGFVEGNRDIDITAVVAVLNQQVSQQLEFVDYETNDITITFQAGIDFYTAHGIFLKDSEEAAAGIGEEVKKTFNFGALKLVNAAGGIVSIGSLIF